MLCAFERQRHRPCRLPAFFADSYRMVVWPVHSSVSCPELSCISAVVWSHRERQGSYVLLLEFSSLGLGDWASERKLSRAGSTSSGAASIFSVFLLLVL